MAGLRFAPPRYAFSNQIWSLLRATPNSSPGFHSDLEIKLSAFDHGEDTYGGRSRPGKRCSPRCWRLRQRPGRAPARGRGRGCPRAAPVAPPAEPVGDPIIEEQGETRGTLPAGGAQPVSVVTPEPRPVADAPPPPQGAPVRPYFSAMSEISYRPPAIQGSSSGYSSHQDSSSAYFSAIPETPTVRPPRGGEQVGRGRPRGGGQSGGVQPATVQPGGG
ncbi:PREDICTED: uncharacterized protein LOC109212237 [Nicotiana attenuata]|uniref:uncharacterized protein LOC109212237 n=1 Tax=Nicotiana attenuata TaxID=49451 RepID=UPI0009054FBB|nr:PREDICTED: uncharacterized protein LOC109212237 [Nicotiana attenuata]